MRIYSIITLLFLSHNLFAQELNIGSGIGINVIPNKEEVLDEKNSFAVFASLEFRPKHAIFSINTEIRTAVGENFDIKFPLYLNFIIGKEVNLLLSLGGYISAKGNYGGIVGTGLQCAVGTKLKPFIRYEFFTEQYENVIPSRYGNSDETQNRPVHFFGVGVRYNLLKQH